MKIDKAIVSSDNNPLYLDFWPIISKMWSIKFGIKPVLLYFGDNATELDKKYGEIISMEILEGIPISTQAQCARIWYAGQCGNDVMITSDIDMLPLSEEYFIKSLEAISDESYVHLNPLSNNTYFPICYNVAKSSTFRKILDIEADWKIFMQKLMQFASVHKDAVQTTWFLDEIYITHKINNNQTTCNIVSIPRKNGINGFRIDRSHWIYDRKKIYDGFYYDSHSVRPYISYKKTIDEIANTSIKSSLNKEHDNSYIPLLTELLYLLKPKKILEIGCSIYSTELFINNCNLVTSINTKNNANYETLHKKFQANIYEGQFMLIKFLYPDIMEFLSNEKLNTYYDFIFINDSLKSSVITVDYFQDLTDTILLHNNPVMKNFICKADWYSFECRTYITTTTIITKNPKLIAIIRSGKTSETYTKSTKSIFLTNTSHIKSNLSNRFPMHPTTYFLSCYSIFKNKQKRIFSGIYRRLHKLLT